MRKIRLMSYWNLHEPSPGQYDFRELDWQMDMMAEYGGRAILCLGKRQPRWPECHMPPWAVDKPKEEWYRALYDFNEAVITRYKNHPALHSWQLENEPLLKSFGYCPDKDFSRGRLRSEFRRLKALDRHHPVVMTLSDNWGLPWRAPKPDVYAHTIYRITGSRGSRVVRNPLPSWFYRLRGEVIRLFWGRPVFIHELQAEPWVHQSIMEVPLDEQLRQCDPKTLRHNLVFARRTGQSPVLLWGLEWWCWLKATHGDSMALETIKDLVAEARR